MTLAFDVHGPLDAPPLVLVHGFTQNRRCWGPIIGDLAGRFRVIAVDAPGHGASPGEHDRADLVEAARLIGEVGGRAHYLGYSMGGRLCLQLACAQPDLVTRLVLIGATPGLVDPGQRAARRTADAALAERLERLGVAAFLDAWLALPLFAGLSPEAQARDERQTNRAAGLAASLRACGTGTQDPLWDDLHRLTMPVLATAGAQDDKFVAIGAAMVDAINGAAAAARRPARARFETIAAAGHTAHLEQPTTFLRHLHRWFDESI